MRLRELCAVGTETLVDMTVKGELSASTVWTAIKGADKYRRAIREGDICSGVDAYERAMICLSCQSSTRREAKRAKCVVVYCGTLGKPEESPATCGCLLATIDREGVTHAGGKTLVASESCPQAKWGAAHRWGFDK